MKRIILFLTILLSTILTALSETYAEKIIRIYNTAVDLEKKERYSEALGYYRQAYDLGETNFAPMKLAEFYALGKGTPKNSDESDKWLIIAANNGNAHA